MDFRVALCRLLSLSAGFGLGGDRVGMSIFALGSRCVHPRVLGSLRFFHGLVCKVVRDCARISGWGEGRRFGDRPEKLIFVLHCVASCRSPPVSGWAGTESGCRSSRWVGVAYHPRFLGSLRFFHGLVCKVVRDRARISDWGGRRRFGDRPEKLIFVSHCVAFCRSPRVPAGAILALASLRRLPIGAQDAILPHKNGPECLILV